MFRVWEAQELPWDESGSQAPTRASPWASVSTEGPASGGLVGGPAPLGPLRSTPHPHPRPPSLNKVPQGLASARSLPEGRRLSPPAWVGARVAAHALRDRSHLRLVALP